MKYRRLATSAPPEEVGSSSIEIGEKRGRPVKKQVYVLDFPLKARGQEGGDKRAPLHKGDSCAHLDKYEVEEDQAQCLQRGPDHFKLRKCSSNNALDILICMLLPSFLGTVTPKTKKLIIHYVPFVSLIKWKGLPSVADTWEPEQHVVTESAQKLLQQFQEQRKKSSEV